MDTDHLSFYLIVSLLTWRPWQPSTDQRQKTRSNKISDQIPNVTLHLEEVVSTEISECKNINNDTAFNNGIDIADVSGNKQRQQTQGNNNSGLQ